MFELRRAKNGEDQVSGDQPAETQAVVDTSEVDAERIALFARAAFLLASLGFGSRSDGRDHPKQHVIGVIVSL
jgi:hypothetical protein